MCGIIGMVGSVTAGDRVRLIAARDLMKHRGPDDAGLWEAPGVILGAQRLSIIDLSSAGHQPMRSPDGRRCIVFNGEIYNHRELRRELERHFRFVSESDTEVLLTGYRHWGFRGLLDRIDGMFAFSIWDSDRRKLFAARDRAGKKPYFYHHDGRAFSFASVQTSLIRMLARTPEIDPHAIDAYLVYQAVPAPLSVFRGVRQLSPAHALTFDADSGETRVERYWSVSHRAKTNESEREIIDRVSALAREGVRKRLASSDVSVGVFLSGGVDSSIVTALAAQESSTPIDAVTLGFEEAEFDERRHARAVAAHTGIRLHEELLRPELVADLPSIVWHYGQPVADVSIVPSHYLAAAARRWMSVALNGDGGDELFGGYSRPILEWMVGPYRDSVPQDVRARIGHILEPSRGFGLRRLRLLAHAGAAASASDAFRYERAFRQDRDDAYAPGFRAAVSDWHPDSLYQMAWEMGDGDNDVDRAMAGDFNTYLPDQLLIKADRASMAHSLEARSPLLDTALIEYAASIPNAIRFRNLETKYVLKRVAARLVPEHTIYRRKRGFVMPASKWLRGELAPYARAALDNPVFFGRGWIRPEFVRRMLEDHFTGAHDWGEHIFTLLVLEVWARIVLDKSLSRDSRMDAFLSKPERRGRAPLRTLQLGMEWFPERPGGLNRVFYELTRHLPDAGVGVRGLVAGTAAVANDSEGRVEGFAPHVDSLVPRLIALVRRGRAAVLGDRERLVVSHFALYTYPVLDSLGSRPLVIHFQGPWGLEGAAEKQNPFSVFAKSMVEQAVYARATSFIVLSSPFGKILEERFGIPPDRIHIIPGGVDANRFAITESRADCRKRLGWPGDRRIVLAVRRLTRRMGLDNLIAAVPQIVERVPDALVLIAGRGAMAAELDDHIRRLGVSDHVRMVGFVEDAVLPHAYRAADLSVVPSVTLEGFGLIVAESLAAGTPALVTPVGGLPEAVAGLSDRLILRGSSPVDLADGIVGALDGSIPMPSADECVAFARENFDWPVIAARVRQVYEAAVP
jgi:asparagine synthase (glutamine-hydrolysing)